MFSSLFDSIPDALVVVDRGGRIVAANARAEALFGYPADGLDGLPVETLVPDESRERHRRYADGYMAQPRVRPMGDTEQELSGQRLDGSRFPVEIALSPFESDAGTRFLASIRDVSETRRVQQSLLRARYDALLARIGQLAVESSDSESVIQAVPSLLAEPLQIDSVVLAMTRAGGGIEVRATSRLPAGWDRIAGELGDPVGKPWNALARGATLTIDAGGALQTGEPPAATAGGEALGVVVPLLDREQPMGALLAVTPAPHRFDHDTMHVLQSVAHLLATLLQRRRSEERLAHSQQLEAIGQLTGGIAHDFNNLLTVMSGSLQLLELEYPASAGASELIASALRSVGRGAELTSKLLAFARRQRLNPQAVDVTAMLAELERMLARTLGESVRIQVECEAALPAVWADPVQLDTALVNLAINARDAMPRGGELTLAARALTLPDDEPASELPPGRYLLISVADTGHGMTPDTLARAIEPFFTTKEGGRGSGLGLSMVYGFVRQSGGLLRFDSELGYGTRVDLLLPAARAATALASSAPATAIDSGTGQTILVVEDEPAVRDISAGFLRSLGYCVKTASSAEQALTLLAGTAPVDLLFSDVMLGSGMDGHELAAAARQQRPQLPILLTSGYDDPLAREQRQPASPFPLLRKPFRREQLAAAVQRALAGRR